MRVVLALDGSAASDQARDLAAELAWPAGTTIRMMSAYELPIVWTGTLGADMSWVDEAEDALRGELAKELEQLSEPLLERGWEIERRVVRGRPATAIVAEARDLGADLIIIGSRGRGPLAAMLLGSTSAEVVDHASCPVLVARGARVSRLLIATDGSDVARSIPARLGEWGIFRGLRGEAISVAPSPEAAFEYVAGLYTLGGYVVPESERERLLDRYRLAAQDAAGELEAIGIRVTPLTVSGDAALQIVESARRLESDLIVTGSRGLRGLEQVILGSVARNVLLHAPCSVLVMKGGLPVAARDEADFASAARHG